MPTVTARDETHPVIRWLMTDARRRVDANDFLEAFAQQLLAAGIDVARITTGVPILHPQIFSFSGLWERGEGVTERLYRAGPSATATMSNSPIRIAYEGGGPVRCDLTAPARDGEFPIVGDLRRDGYTDYVVYSVPFADGSHKALSLATRRAGGFNADELALFAAMIPAIAFNIEVQALRRTARTLLDTYVGQQSGGRVLEGQITRGSGETIRAVIWLCDLRGFTSLSEALPRDALIDLLNSYFGPMCDAVAGAGGEILKFIGDAMLAIFPIGDDPASICRAALAAAERAQAALSEENAKRERAGLPRIEYGLALHIGDVMYGNIGSDTRLDFTVIGPAVNLTARIESMCRQLGRQLLLSSDFVGAGSIPATSLGAHSLKGVGSEQEIFAPA
ncbi:adenylate/guanylate cyclase domain-containing protein [Bradyrhizobium erythrophlei]|uniref:adenylate/guanylate cyclase domain-containing protein n=1 Tax=Bradyrhizobium erythrophlei TaxID=1437360 RepID=UPI0035EC5B2D